MCYIATYGPFVQNLYYVCILAMYGPVKNLKSVLKQNCDIDTYGPGNFFMLCQTEPILGV